MTDATISLRIDKRIHSMMRMHDEINWSAILRKTLAEKLRQLDVIDRDRALQASKSIDKLREKKIFDKGEAVTKIIRRWRDKRK